MTISAFRARRNMSSLCNKLCGTIVSEEFPTWGFVSFLMKKNNTKSKHNDSVENPWGIGLNFSDEFFVNNHISDSSMRLIRFLCCGFQPLRHCVTPPLYFAVQNTEEEV